MSGKCFSHADLFPLYPNHCQLTAGHCLFAQCKYNAFYLPFNPFPATTCFKIWKFQSHFPLLLSLSYPFFMRFEIEPYISATCYRPPCCSSCLDRHSDTKEPKRGVSCQSNDWPAPSRERDISYQFPSVTQT